MRLEIQIRLSRRAHVADFFQHWHKPEREAQLHPGLHARTKQTDAGTIGPGKLLQAQTACSTCAHCRYSVAIDNAYWASRHGVNQNDRGLVRLAAELPVAGPEPCGFKAEQVLSRYVARFDAKYPARGKWLPYHRENTSLASAM